MVDVKYKLNQQKQKLGVIYRYYRNYSQKLATRYAEMYKNKAIEPNTILFESRDGASFTDSPLALYLYLLDTPEYNDYTFYWTYTDKSQEQIATLKKDKRVQFVKRNSDAYLKALTTCQYAINNSTFQNFYVKKEGQTYINTWHGTPLKKMGFDIPDEIFGARNVLRNLLMADYFISPNQYTTEVFRQAYKLDGLYSGEIIENGYPRIDMTTCQNEDIYKQLAQAGVNIDRQRKIILYTPTWKGNDFQNPRTLNNQLRAEIDLIHEKLGNEYQVLCKVHPFAYEQVKEAGYLDGYLIPDSFDANQVLSITDVLITDYSSIFFDYLVTNKPIIFYCWDKEGYEAERGLYFSENLLPGPVETTIFGVVERLQNLTQVQDEYKDKYQEMKDKMCSYQDGNVTAKIANYIFKQEQEVNIVKVPRKKTLLIYAGALKVNGITAALQSLIANIDRSKYDITILTNMNISHHGAEKDAVLNNIKQLVQDVRVLFRFGQSIYTLDEAFKDKDAFKVSNKDIDYPIDGYMREARRLTAACHFDVAIDYSGYSHYWAKLIAFTSAGKHLIYQHNDLYEEQYKVVNKRRVHFSNLQGVFKLYRYFDKIVNVSEAVCEVNAQKLSAYAPREQFVTAHNLLQIDQIQNGKEDSRDFVLPTLSLTRSIEQSFKVEANQLVYYKDLNQTQGKILELDDNHILTGVMQTYNKGEYYIKFAYKGLIYGWCKQSDLEDTYDEIIMRRDVKFDAYIKKVRRQYYYTEPAYTSSTAKSVDSLTRLWNAKVTVVEEVITPYDIYQKITFNNNVIGWVSQNNLTPIKKAKQKITTKVKNQLTTYSKVKKRSIAKQNVNRLFEVKPGKHPIYTHALDTYKAKVFKFLDVKEPMTVVAVKRSQTSKQISYCIKPKHGKRGWIAAEALINERDAHVFISVKELNAEGYFISSWTPIFKTDQEVLASYLNMSQINDYQNTAYFQNKPIKIVAEARTLWQRFYQVSINNQLYYVPAQALKVRSEKSSNKPMTVVNSNIQNWINVARMSPEKNQINLIKAMNLLFDEHPEYLNTIKLYLIGDGALSQEIANLIKQYKLEEQIIMLGRLHDPYPIMKQCQTLIFPSKYEGQGLVLLEALILGLDIVASDIPTSVEVLDNGRYGMLANGTDPESLKEAMIKYLQTKPKFDQFDYKMYNQNAMSELISLL